MKSKSIVTIITALLMSLMFSNKMAAQSFNNYMRIAKITVDSSQLEPYMIALKEQMKAALKLEEKGVLAYSAVYDKNNLTHITILETYANVDAYKAHIQTSHFKKYKATVEHMVKSLELIDVIPIGIK